MFNINTIIGILIPFLGTSLGAGCVFLLGMAVGVVFSGFLTNSAGITLAGAIALSVGIAIQNFPEGAVISMPLINEGVSKKKAFFHMEYCRAL